MRHFALPLALISLPAAAQTVAPQDEAVLKFPATFFAEAQPATAYDMIQRLPGFTFAKGDADVRGFAGSAGNVLLDGRRPATKQDDLETILKRIPASAVLRIELIRGGTDGIDMQGQPVLANVIRRAEAAVRGQAEVSMGQYGDGRVVPIGRANISRKSGSTLTEASIDAARTIDDEKGRGPRTRRNADGSLREALVYDERDRVDSGGFNLNHERDLFGGRLRLTGSARREHEQAATDLATSFPAPADEKVLELETKDSAEAGINWERPLAHNLSLELLALQRLTRDDATEHSDDGSITEDVASRSHGGESIGRALLRWQPSKTIALEGGGEAAFNYLDSHASLATNGVPVTLPAANVRVAEHRAEGFATATWQASPALTIESGMRIETSRLVQSGDSNLSKSFVFTKPRLLVSWSPTTHSQLRLRAERVVGQLDFKDFVSSTSLTSSTITAGNQNLEPERKWLASLVWERRFAGAGAFVLTAQHEWISHTADRVGVFGPGFAFDAPGNIGNGQRSSLAANLSLPLDKLWVPGGLIKAEVTYTWSSVIDPTTGQRRAITDDKPIQGEVHFTQDRPIQHFRWGADLILGEVKREYRFNEVRRSRVDARTSLFVEYMPAPRWTLRLYAENLTSRHVERDRDIYAGARNILPLRYAEVRDLGTKPLVGLLVRRRFGN